MDKNQKTLSAYFYVSPVVLLPYPVLHQILCPPFHLATPLFLCPYIPLFFSQRQPHFLLKTSTTTKSKKEKNKRSWVKENKKTCVLFLNLHHKSWWCVCDLCDSWSKVATQQNVCLSWYHTANRCDVLPTYIVGLDIR